MGNLGKGIGMFGQFGSTEISAARGEIGQEGVEAVDGKAIRGKTGGFLSAHGARRLGGGDGIAAPTVGVEFFVLEQKRCPGFAHVPLDVVGQEAQEDVCADVIVGAMANGAHQNVHALQTAKGLFHQAEVFVLAHDIVGRQAFHRFAGPHET